MNIKFIQKFYWLEINIFRNKEHSLPPFPHSYLVKSSISHFEYKVNLLNKGFEAVTVLLLKIQVFQGLNLRIKCFLYWFSRCCYTGSFL